MGKSEKSEYGENTNRESIWEIGGVHKIKCMMFDKETGGAYTIFSFDEERFLDMLEEKDMEKEIIVIEYERKVYRNDTYRTVREFVNELSRKKRMQERNPIPKNRQIPGQIDIFCLELWEV